MESHTEKGDLNHGPGENAWSLKMFLRARGENPEAKDGVVAGRATRKPGPASECQTNSVVADTLQVPVSTFVCVYKWGYLAQ